MDANYLKPDWPAPNHVSAFTSRRGVGYSGSPYHAFNLATHVGDAASHVAQNRQQLGQQLDLPNEPLWLSQIHSTEVVDHRLNAPQPKVVPTADGSFTGSPNQVCAVLTADCLPILLCDKQGQWVAAVHAGWRGLAAGILQKTIACYNGRSDQLLAWIGPAIGRDHFQVDEVVKQKFVGNDVAYGSFFKATDSTHYQCDLIGICRQILSQLQVLTFGGHWCSYKEQDFYSYRRDGVTGRMASLIWINHDRY